MSPNKGRQWQKLLGCDNWILYGSPEPTTAGFRNLVGVGIVSKKLAINSCSSGTVIALKKWFMIKENWMSRTFFEPDCVMKSRQCLLCAAHTSWEKSGTYTQMFWWLLIRDFRNYEISKCISIFIKFIKVYLRIFFHFILLNISYTFYKSYFEGFKYLWLKIKTIESFYSVA